MLSGINGVSKLQAAIEITCLLFLLVGETDDHVHVLVLGDEIIDIPKSQGDKGITYLISSLEKYGVLDEMGRVEIERPPLKEATSEDAKIKSIMKHTGKNREIVIFSDFVDFIGATSLKRFIFRKNLHCFFMESPLDKSVEKPISIFTSGKTLSNKNSFKSILSIKEKDIEKELGKKIKKLNIGDRYLESFIKEMV